MGVVMERWCPTQQMLGVLLMAGFIYIMSNPSFVSGRIKIGKSDRDPEEFRKFELDGTSVPEPFEVEYYAYVDDHHRIERSLHRTFGYARANKQREFFDVPVWKVVEEIKNIAEIKFEADNYTTEETETQRREIPNSRTKCISQTCTKCSTPFSVTVISGEYYTRCPKCFQILWNEA
jgi:T5orf172 domain